MERKPPVRSALVQAVAGNFDHLMGTVRALAKGHNGLVDDLAKVVERLTSSTETQAQHNHQGGELGNQLNHGNLVGVSADQHHTQQHHHNGDGSGDVSHDNLTGVSANDHHSEIHNNAEHTESYITQIEFQEGNVFEGAGDIIDFDGDAFDVAVAAGEAVVDLHFGTGAGNPAAGNHDHDADYDPLGEADAERADHEADFDHTLIGMGGGGPHDHDEDDLVPDTAVIEEYLARPTVSTEVGGATHVDFTPSTWPASTINFTSGSVTLDTLVAGVDGQEVTIRSSGATVTILAPAAASGTAANKFDFGADNLNHRIRNGMAETFRYNATAARWQTTGTRPSDGSNLGDNVAWDTTGSTGTAGAAPAPWDHGHEGDTYSSTPAAVAAAGSAGASGSNPARGPHVHPHGSGYAGGHTDAEAAGAVAAHAAIENAHGMEHADLNSIGADDHHTQAHGNADHTSAFATAAALAAHLATENADHGLEHADLNAVGADDHHATLHAHDGVDGSGTVSYNDLDDLPGASGATYATVWKWS